MSRNSYYRKLERDLIIYGDYYEQKVAYSWSQKLVRWLRGLPTDRKYISPKNLLNISSTDLFINGKKN